MLTIPEFKPKELNPHLVDLIDADVVAYQASYGRDHEMQVVDEIKLQLNRIQATTLAGHRVLYLTGKDNFRESVAAIRQYKGNRYNPDGTRRKPQPALLGFAKSHLIEQYGAEVQDGQEADDALVIAQTAFNRAHAEGSPMRSIISTIDKDLRICPGLHHNIGNSCIDEVSVLGDLTLKGSKLGGGGLRFFYAQLLMGDSTDFIPGLPRVTEEMVELYGCRRGGCGAAAAYKVLAGARDEFELFSRVYGCYISYWTDIPRGQRYALDAIHWETGEEIPSSPIVRLVEQGRLLWMRTKPGEMWLPKTEFLTRYAEEADNGM